MSFLRRSLELFSGSFESKSSAPPTIDTKIDTKINNTKVDNKPSLDTSSDNFVTRSPSIAIPPNNQQNRESSWYRMVQVVEVGSL
ncbi:hypothetical protein PPL_11818 [Heterostelium album PN500]|uniref:Uncharacterized protein n=1 Tax=Heterostelium pallidum (strain ATCC 26659 / Pp 5 / PN500) TaxID=670386 RepID=D3BUJ7_HETP5|nr:hypothetical protein PPL_11818 [Heterostelium album PN500]EFA74785.1 hypothetical protein PPL_11818 [Heterostelium album PN500]|eukprot:XP_020426919.1 hypothetical protein PPL_11818 [Heterostelium album PN500]